ncbi:MAG TPA: Gfo/Idh/MocA family oxidoreductase, partial [Gemmataceae bacterium]|nr:Gfo/Idh/MocA family oxidoreductase [Gemmataceae bacterium]
VVSVICEVDEAVVHRERNNPLKAAEAAQGFAPKWERDLRRVLEDKTLDVVAIATPNHWHALAAIWALQAGKDVYVEKPVSHNVSEGRRIVEAARHYKRICQAGTQSRSSTGLKEAMAFLHAGKLGKVKVARGLCYKPRGSIGKVKGEQPIPRSIDYDLWCGPAPKKPLMRQRLHYDWHWTWDYGNGDLGNQGIHEMDKARWGLARNDLAKSVLSVGGRFGYVDDGETANTQLVVFDYGDAELIFEVRGLKTKDLLGAKVGVIFYGSDGYMVCPSYESGIVYDKDGKEVRRFTTPKEKGGDGGHFGNFVKAVRSGQVSDLTGDILEGHLSSALCHLANVSYRLGSEQPYSKTTKAFGDDKDAAETLARTSEHLKENRVPLDETNYRVGRRLTVDPAKETFVGDTQANAMLTREYRKPFVVPEKV